MGVSIKKILDPGTSFEHRFIPDYDELSDIVKRLKEMGYRVVLTQGVYDLVHGGHALYLEKARSHGDILIVGVDSDELTKSRKGPSRPIVPENERLQMLMHLRHVDIVTVRDITHDIGHLIKLVRPHVLVTSETTEDFTKKFINSYKKYCEKIVTLPAQATTSTSARVRHLSISGASQLAEEIMRNIPKLVDDALAKLADK